MEKPQSILEINDMFPDELLQTPPHPPPWEENVLNNVWWDESYIFPAELRNLEDTTGATQQQDLVELGVSSHVWLDDSEPFNSIYTMPGSQQPPPPPPASPVHAGVSLAFNPALDSLEEILQFLVSNTKSLQASTSSKISTFLRVQAANDVPPSPPPTPTPAEAPQRDPEPDEPQALWDKFASFSLVDYNFDDCEILATLELPTQVSANVFALLAEVKPKVCFQFMQDDNVLQDGEHVQRTPLLLPLQESTTLEAPLFEIIMPQISYATHQGACGSNDVLTRALVESELTFEAPLAARKRYERTVAVDVFKQQKTQALFLTAGTFHH
jgi:hypothetical protein